MGSFAYRLEYTDGDARRPALASHGLTDVAGRRHHPVGRDKTLRVVGTRPGIDPDEDPV
jgi:hypothetical protein